VATGKEERDVEKGVGCVCGGEGGVTSLSMASNRFRRSSAVRMGYGPPSPPFPAMNWPPASRRSISARTGTVTSRSSHRAARIWACRFVRERLISVLP